MKTIPMLAGLALALTLPNHAQAQGPVARMIMQRMMAKADPNKAPEAPPKQTIAYGRDAMQNLDFYRAQGTNRPAPLVIFVHGGAWSKGTKDNGTGAWKAPHYTSLGYHFATINYRLVPDAKVEDEAQDVANALAKLLADADKLGIDRSRIVLMGHSAGAHLVALVGTDETYLKQAGLGLSALAGIIPIDGAAYDVPKQMAAAGQFMEGRYDQAFGHDPARQKALSPVFHAQAPNAPRFLLLYVGREDGVAQAKELAEALTTASTPVQQQQFEGKGLLGHMTINRRMGDPDYEATPIVDRWMKALFGR
jgi:arylformamidase